MQPTLWLALLATGALAGTAALAGAPAAATAAELSDRAPSKRPSGTKRFVIALRYTGEKRSVGKIEVDEFGLERRTERIETSKYVAKSRTAVRVNAYCLGPHSRFLPPALRDVAGACRDIRRIAMSELEGVKRRRFLSSYNRDAKEAYELPRRATLSGDITASRIVSTSAPITVPGPGGRGSVKCNPETQTTETTQAGLQRGLNVIVTTGANPRTPVSRRTTQNGMGIESKVPLASILAPRHVIQNPVHCPAAAGRPPETKGGIQDFDGLQRWTPLDFDAHDRLFNGKPPRLQLAFTKPPGRFGRRFNATVELEEKNDEPIGPTRGIVQTLERHTYRFTFCPRGTPRARC